VRLQLLLLMQLVVSMLLLADLVQLLTSVHFA
jgi:hypothetical protein